MINGGSKFEEHENLRFPQDPRQGPCRVELEMRIYNPDGRGFEIKVPNIEVDGTNPLVLQMGVHPNDETLIESAEVYTERPYRNYIGLQLPASEMLPKGIIDSFTMTLIDPEDA